MFHISQVLGVPVREKVDQEVSETFRSRHRGRLEIGSKLSHQLTGGRDAVIGCGLQALPHKLFKPGGQVGYDLAHRGDLGLADPLHHLRLLLPRGAKETAPREAFVENNSEAKEVAAFIELLRRDLLGAEVAELTRDDGAFSRPLERVHMDNAKITELSPATKAEEDVVGLESRCTNRLRRPLGIRKLWV